MQSSLRSKSRNCAGAAPRHAVGALGQNVLSRSPAGPQCQRCCADEYRRTESRNARSLYRMGRSTMSERRCFLCGRNGARDPLERHHIFGGSFRGKSERYGAVVWLCGDRCHRNGKSAVHRNGDQMRRLRRYGQLTIMQNEGWTEDDFRREFGKSYL